MAVERWEVLLPATIDASGPESIEEIATFTGLDEYDDRAALLADVDRFDAIIVRVAELDAELIDAATSLTVVSKHGAGLDNVDVEAASRNGVVVCNTPGANSRSVAEHAVGLILATRKRVLPADEEVRAGGWERHRFLNSELRSDTLGLLGFGNIARETASIATGFEMECVTHDPFVPEEEMPAHVEKVEGVRELFERADVVSVHTPLTAETRHLVSTEELEALGPDGIVVNTSRGGVIDESALVDALDRDAVGGAGIDVFSEEPPDASHPLLDRKTRCSVRTSAGSPRKRSNG